MLNLCLKNVMKKQSLYSDPNNKLESQSNGTIILLRQMKYAP